MPRLNRALKRPGSGDFCDVGVLGLPETTLFFVEHAEIELGPRKPRVVVDDLFERRLRARQLLDLDEACAQVQAVLSQLRLDFYRLFQIRQRRRRLVSSDVDVAEERVRLRVPVVQRERPLAQGDHLFRLAFLQQDGCESGQGRDALRIVLEHGIELRLRVARAAEFRVARPEHQPGLGHPRVIAQRRFQRSNGFAVVVLDHQLAGALDRCEDTQLVLGIGQCGGIRCGVPSAAQPRLPRSRASEAAPRCPCRDLPPPAPARHGSCRRSDARALETSRARPPVRDRRCSLFLQSPREVDTAPPVAR